uniref:Transcription factor CBF/NF-Y/archaeal histone domain-containing protein n=1 Tax=Cannabis sativa TaxID=3483 RepID=A0A803NQJ1_CANSA
MVDNLGNNREREGFHHYNNCSSGGPSSTTNISHHQDQIDHHGFIKEQDRLLPIANVGRIMKQILPPNAKISKEAKETMQECVSEFISFVTGEASDKCHKEKRKTVNGDDICWALAALGFDDYAEPLKSLKQIVIKQRVEASLNNVVSNYKTSAKAVKERASKYKDSYKQAHSHFSTLEVKVTDLQAKIKDLEQNR